MSRRTVLLGLVACALAVVIIAGVLADAPAPHPPKQTRSSATHESRPGGPQWSVIGHSRQGRPLVSASFGSGRRRLLVIGGVHGQEFGRKVAYHLAEYLADHPAAVPAGTGIDVIPSLNPDGTALHRRGNARNVDLNRNFPTADWRRSLRPGDPAALTCNGGAGPASEPETRALLRYLRRGFDCVISLHSSGGFIDFNGPHGRRIAAVMSLAAGLPVRRIAYQQSITGSLGEYVPSAYRIPVITVELRRPVLTRGLVAAIALAAALASPSH